MEMTPDGRISLSMKDAPGNVLPERPAPRPAGELPPPRPPRSNGGGGRGGYARRP